MIGILSLIGMLGLPALAYYLILCVHVHEGILVIPEWQDLEYIHPTLDSLFLGAVWLLLQAGLHIVIPGKRVMGPPLADGTRLEYKMNGMLCFGLSLGLYYLASRLNWLSPTLVYRELGGLLTTMTLFSFAISLWLFIWGRRSGGEGTAGNHLQDFFLGTTLNPRIGPFDFKFFLESRPGLIGWIAINYSLAAQQFQTHGSITVPMYLVFAFQFLYVADFFWHEEAILTTWDIRHEKLGWMLVWGNLVWVPMLYTLQAQYLVDHVHELPLWATAAIVALNLVGYAIFRGANWQKHQFRLNPEAAIWGRKPEYIRTRAGTFLLVSGYWGVARHLNYLGDLLMALAWCLPCGFGNPLPYFYLVFFTFLLVHRERRDNGHCLEKYGPDWQEYCRRVPWRIIPFVY